MRNRIFGVIGILWGGAILVSGLLSSSSGGSEAYQAGQAGGAVIGALLFGLGIYYVRKKPVVPESDDGIAICCSPTFGQSGSTQMEITKDIAKKIEELFPETEWPMVKELVANAKIHDGELADDRLRRCVVFASEGSMEKLNSYLDLLKDDFRDVIVAGECNDWVQVRDLNKPF